MPDVEAGDRWLATKKPAYIDKKRVSLEKLTLFFEKHQDQKFKGKLADAS